MALQSARSILFLTAIGCVVMSPVPATAQEHDWARVRRLRPGTQLVISMIGLQPIRRSIVTADGSQLTTLNLDDWSLPTDVVRVLLKIASNHPEAFHAPYTGRFVDSDISVGPDGIFLRGRKIAELQHIAETVRRDDVDEIKARRKGGGILGHLGPIGGYFIGGLAGGYIGALACRCDSGFLPGMVAGGIGGAGLGYRAAARDREQLVYRRSRAADENPREEDKHAADDDLKGR
jgi:hypothetical protein